MTRRLRDGDEREGPSHLLTTAARRAPAAVARPAENAAPRLDARAPRLDARAPCRDARAPRLVAPPLLFALLGAAACASTTAPAGPTPVVEARADAASPRRDDDAAIVEGAVDAWARRRAEIAHACLVGRGCDEPPPTLALDDDTIRRALAVPAGDARRGRLRAAVARSVVEDAVAPVRRAQARTRRTLSFADDGAVFSFDDVHALLRAAPPERRLGVLASARAALVVRTVEDAAVRAAVDAAAARFATTTPALLASRAGLDPDALRSLARRVVEATDARLADDPLDLALAIGLSDPSSATAIARAGEGARLGAAPYPVCVVVDAPGDVRLALPPAQTDAQARASRAALGADAMARALLPDELVDPILVQAAALAARDPRPATEPARRALGASLLLEGRAAALATLAELDGASLDADHLDALGTTLAGPRGAVVAGAGALLDVDGAGTAGEHLVAVLLSAALAGAFADDGSAAPGRLFTAASLARTEGLDALAAQGGAPTIAATWVEWVLGLLAGR